MDVSADSIPPEWIEYSVNQQKVNRSKIDPYTWALEDQLNRCLDDLGRGVLPHAGARTTHLENLVRNRTKKHARRIRLLEEYCRARSAEVNAEGTITRQIDQRNKLRWVRARVSVAEWRIMCRLACGQDYASCALAEGITVATLKSSVWRCRRRLSKIADLRL